MVDCVIVPGNLHKNFIKTLNFDKEIFITKSVGIIKPFQKKKIISKKNKINIVYIGRISEEKKFRIII